MLNYIVARDELEKVKGGEKESKSIRKRSIEK
jgi:hypothetical protein